MNPQYEALAMCILPNHMLDWFDLTKVEVTSKSGTNIINLYLEENTEVPEGKLDRRSNGFTKEKVFHDFPIRGQEVLLHVKRRRWIDSEGHNQMTEFDFIQESTRCSKELADFLKDAFGNASYNGPFT